MQHSVGLVGLGTMGAALALNVADKGFPIVVWNRTQEVTQTFHDGAGTLKDRITPADTLDGFVAALKPPRAVILMVPAGDAVDQQIESLRPLLSPEDIIIDAGNANFHDTNRRAAAASESFLGIGVSGGEEGARHGPSIMGGGEKDAWDKVAPLMMTIAAQYDGTACAGWLGEEGAGHFVKTVHNGIEYADMQMIAEVYGIFRDGLTMSADEIAEVFERWNRGALRSYLIEISGKVSRANDAVSGRPLLDMIVDAAGQKGTGRWTVIEAQHLAAATPTIEAAVAARNLSGRRSDRARAEALFGAAPQAITSDALTVDLTEHALIAGKIICYAQGFDMIARAANSYGWALPLAEIARIWRAGCIIRSEMLSDMAIAFDTAPEDNLIFTDHFANLIKSHQQGLRSVVSQAAALGHPTPALSAALAYLDTMRTARGTANMIQAQRDFFGLHGYERVDDGRTGQHGPWAQKG